MPILFQYGPKIAWLIREFNQTMTETATTASPSKRFNKQNFGFASSLKSLYNPLGNEKMKDANAAMTPLKKFPEKISGKNSGLERDSNPRPLRYRCNALPAGYQSPMRAVVSGFGPSCSVDVILGLSM